MAAMRLSLSCVRAAATACLASASQTTSLQVAGSSLYGIGMETLTIPQPNQAFAVSMAVSGMDT